MAHEIKIMIARHGDKMPDGSLDPRAIPGLYHSGNQVLEDFVRQGNYQPRDAGLYHSNEPRTRHSGLAHLAGAFVAPIGAQTLDDLDKLELPDLRVVSSSDFSYLPNSINMQAIKSLGGPDAYIEKWFLDPNRDEFQGYESWKAMQKRAGLGVFVVLKDARSTGKGLCLIDSHGAILEPVTQALIDSGRHCNFDKVNSLGEIGGCYKPGEYMVLTANSNHHRGDATLGRNGFQFPVDLDKFLDIIDATF